MALSGLCIFMVQLFGILISNTANMDACLYATQRQELSQVFKKC